jgi:putative transcriptional regulator
MNKSPQHHPDKNLLIEFAAGTLERAPAIAVKTHLHYCPKCTLEVQQLEQVGAALFLSGISEPSTENTDKVDFTELMKKIDGIALAAEQVSNTTHIRDDENNESSHTHSLPSKYAALPQLVKKMMRNDEVKWQYTTKNLRSANLIAGQDQYAVSLQNILAGGHVPEHEHMGDEITVVLKGSFSDENNMYQQGDFLLKSIGDRHRPMASSNEDCLCLSVEQAPVKLTGTISRLLNPFIKINKM